MARLARSPVDSHSWFTCVLSFELSSASRLALVSCSRNVTACSVSSATCARGRGQARHKETAALPPGRGATKQANTHLSCPPPAPRQRLPQLALELRLVGRRLALGGLEAAAPHLHVRAELLAQRSRHALLRVARR
jgi:hypothetical protein